MIKFEMNEIISKLDNECFLIIAFTMLIMVGIVLSSYKYSKDVLNISLKKEK